MKNTHLEHPEDCVVLGKQSVRQVLKFLRERNSTVSVKYDGAPAIVFGTNPENGKFFVGTKSVFNKVKVKINYTHADIEQNHSNNEKVAAILHTCLETLPRVAGVYQCDFIGYGGAQTFTPNAITYDFTSRPDILDYSLIVATHTRYVGDTIKSSEASFGVPDTLRHLSSSVYHLDTNAHFDVTSRSRRVDYLLALGSVVCNFIATYDKKEQERLTIEINKCIREHRKVDCLKGANALLFNIITEVKELLMRDIVVHENVDAYIDWGIDKDFGHEGYVMTNKYGTYKLINRSVFSYANFTKMKSW